MCASQHPTRPVANYETREPRSRPWIWAVYVVLFGGSVPWYLPAGGPMRLWFGLPHWVVISIAASLGVALFTLFVISRFWSDTPDDEAPPHAEDGAT